MPTFTGVSLLAYGLMFLGLIGSVLPLVPGPLLIWLGALVWAWENGFEAVGWPTLLVLGILTVLAWGSDLFLTVTLGRRSGVSWKAVASAIVGGLAGGILFGGWIPVLGTVVATVAGGIAGILLAEYVDKRDWSRAVQAARSYILAFFASTLAETLLALLMLALFIWQAFL